MFILCILAMIMLHSALRKVLQICFDNFQSDFITSQDISSKPQTHDVEQNTEIFQFNIAALYQLQVTWMNKYVCISSYRQIQIDKHVHTETKITTP